MTESHQAGRRQTDTIKTAPDMVGWLKLLVPTILIPGVIAAGAMYAALGDVAENRDEIRRLAQAVETFTLSLSDRATDKAQWTSIGDLKARVAAAERSVARFDQLSGPEEQQFWGLVKNTYPNVVAKNEEALNTTRRLEILLDSLQRRVDKMERTPR